jgi:hypothetical protein
MIESVTNNLILWLKTIIIHSSCDNIWYVNTAHSQSPISGFMQGRKRKYFSSLSSWKYDKVTLVPQETDGVPWFNIQLNSTLYATYGLSDN